MPVSPTLPRRISLSQQDMVAISQAISRDFSPRFVSRRRSRDRQSQFSPQELREISRQISRDFAPNPASDKSRLVLLPVTPRKLHVYWQIAKQRLLKAIGGGDTQPALPSEAPQLTLRIYPPADVETAVSGAETTEVESDWIEIPVTRWQGQIDVPLPDALVNRSNDSPSVRPYQAVLGQVGQDHSFQPLAYSNSIIPPTPVRPMHVGLLPPELLAFIMPLSTASSPTGKTASGQGNYPPDE